VIIAGVDEVGRGPLAGPVVTAAVILPEEYDLPGLTDSKKLTSKKREVLSVLIREQAIAWTLAEADIEEIDRLNILHATMLAMQRAVASLKVKPEKVLVDGNRTPDFGIPACAVVGGDGLEPTISAASIIAKVSRDKLMTVLSETAATLLSSIVKHSLSWVLRQSIVVVSALFEMRWSGEIIVDRR